MDDFVTKHGIECEWSPRPTYDVCMTDEFLQYEATALKGLRQAGGEPEDFSILDKETAQQVRSSVHSNTFEAVADNQETRVEAAIGGYKWPAATLNPAKLTLGIHTLSTQKGGYELYSWAPVHSVTPAEGQGWTVTTPRGSVRADKVVFATNAYSQAIVPELEGLITPWKAQAVKLPPAPAGEKAFPKLEPS